MRLGESLTDLKGDSTASEEALTELVLQSLQGGGERKSAVLKALVRHAHAFIRETSLSHSEWLAAIDVLKNVASWCDERRDEMILLSDNLGISAMVDLVSDRHKTDATETTGLGPFHVGNQPFFSSGDTIVRHEVPGEPLWFELQVTNPDGEPLEGAEVDVWQAHAEGLYDLQEGANDNLRGRFRTDRKGRISFRSVMPEGYPLPGDGPCHKIFAEMKSHYGRPAHVHMIVSFAGYRTLTTHLFVEGDPLLEKDAVYGVRPTLTVPFSIRDKLSGEEPAELEPPYWHAQADIVLDYQRGSDAT